MKRRVVVVLIVALVVTGALVATMVALANRNQNAGVTLTPSVTPSASNVATPTVAPTASNLATPTVAPTATKSEAPQSPHPTPQPASSPPSQPVIPGAAAVVTLASYDKSKAAVVVGGFVSGVIEDGGTCTFTVTATDTGASTTLTSTGAINVDSTTCGSREVAAPDSKSGAYTVTLEYSNAVGAVTSSPVPVEGP